LADLAAKQHGVVAYRQLLALGFGPGAIEHRVRFGRLLLVHRGVYAAGHARVSDEGRHMAAVLACGDGAALSRWSAARRWELLRVYDAVIDVVVCGDAHGRIGIRLHRARDLHRHDMTRRDGIPTTSVPRTLLDLAVVAPDRALKRAVNEADRRGRLNREAVRELLERNQGRRGTRRLRAVIARVDPGTRRTRSELEVDFRKLWREFKIEEPISNETVAGYEVDMFWPEADLIVELDHYDYHRTPAEFTNDRRKWAALKKLGHEVLPVSDEWLNNDPREVAETVRALLGQSGNTGGSIASSL
jgi:very-short-patch-repair endonuclease